MLTELQADIVEQVKKMLKPEEEAAVMLRTRERKVAGSTRHGLCDTGRWQDLAATMEQFQKGTAKSNVTSRSKRNSNQTMILTPTWYFYNKDVEWLVSGNNVAT